jgi:hypothetical protein
MRQLVYLGSAVAAAAVHSDGRAARHTLQGARAAEVVVPSPYHCLLQFFVTKVTKVHVAASVHANAADYLGTGAHGLTCTRVQYMVSSSRCSA